MFVRNVWNDNNVYETMSDEKLPGYRPCIACVGERKESVKGEEDGVLLGRVFVIGVGDNKRVGDGCCRTGRH